MLFAILNFVFSGFIAIIGIMTLRKVSRPKEIIFAGLPLLFAMHQFTQGFVWLGVYHLIEPATLQIAQSIFVVYAQGFLEFLVPFALWLIEPRGVRKNLIGLLAVIGAALMGYTLWVLSVQPTSVFLENGMLVYINPWTDILWFGLIYVLTTCGSLIVSSSIAVRLFGWLNLIGLTIVYLFNPNTFTSLWCLYAAMVSIFLYFYFIERRITFLQTIKETELVLGDKLEQELHKLQRYYPHLRRKLELRFKR